MCGYFSLKKELRDALFQRATPYAICSFARLTLGKLGVLSEIGVQGIRACRFLYQGISLSLFIAELIYVIVVKVKLPRPILICLLMSCKRVMHSDLGGKELFQIYC